MIRDETCDYCKVLFLKTHTFPDTPVLKSSRVSMDHSILLLIVSLSKIFRYVFCITVCLTIEYMYKLFYYTYRGTVSVEKLNHYLL